MTIPTIKLNSGTSVPVVGLGFFRTELGVAPQIAYQGLKEGYRLLDTAMIYGNEQEVVEGIVKWLKEDPEHNKREDVIYTTKIFDPDHGYEKTKAAVATALKTARDIGYIDIVLVHSPVSDPERRHGTWTALQEAVESGKVKNIGVSNYGVKHLQEIFAYPDYKIKPVLDQLELTPWLNHSEITGFLQQNNIVAEAYSPLAKGKRLDDADLIKISKKYGKTPAQVLIRWSIDKGFVPLPKTSNEGRLTENLDVFDFKLTKEEVELLETKEEGLVLGGGGRDRTVYP